jgi:hypothetical protein
MAIDDKGQGFMSGEMNETDVGFELTRAVENILSRKLHTAMPGRVDAYASGKADIKPLLKKASVDGTQTEYATLYDVPVLFSERAALSIGLSVGDIVLLVFCEGSLENWTANGAVANTSVNRKFSVADGFAIPLICSSGVISLQALMTEAFKTALGTYLDTLHTCITAIGATGTPGSIVSAVTTYSGAYPTGFSAPANSVTTKVKAT